MPPVKKVQDEVALQLGLNSREVDELEEYLIDFSKALKGVEMPPDLNRDKFFEVLEKHYPRKEIIDAVKEYYVKAANKDESYDLLVCDKERRWRLYRDYGETLDFVEYPYWPDGERVECRDPFLIPLAVWWGEAYAVGIVVATQGGKEEKIPICP